MSLKEINTLPEFQIDWDDVNNGRFIPSIVNYSLEHGPIFRFQGEDATFNGLILVGPEANRFVFHTGRHHFSHERGWTPILGNMVGRGLINMDDPDHAAHRKLWNPAFTNNVMLAYIPVLHKIISQKLKRFATLPFINTHTESQEITFDVAAAALAGIEEGEQLDRLRAFFWRMLHGEGIETDEAYQAMMAEVQAEMLPMLLGMIHSRRENRPNQRDVLSEIVHATFEDGSRLQDSEILGHLNVLLLAGHETTTTLSAWLIYQLASLPDHWEQLQAEVDAALSDIPIGETDQVPTPEMLRQMPRLDNFIKETGRLYSPVFQVPRFTSSETEFGGYRIPADTRVRLSLAGTHMHPEIFAEPERFDPDRFAEPRREDRARPYSLVTFGGGPRICIGLNFATIEVKVLAAQILRHYRLTPHSTPEKVHVGYWNSLPRYPLEVTFLDR